MIFRVEKTKNYTTMSNYHLRETKMSLKAKGLMSWMLSNTDDWDYSISGIVKNCKENETAIRSTLKELQAFGYLEVKKLLPESIEHSDGNKEVIRGRIEYEYIIHEQPIQIQDVENLHTENLYTENLYAENQAQRNTKERNTKERNTNKDISISKDIDMDIVENIKKSSSNDIKDTCIKYFIDMYHNICVSLPRVRTITDKRKKAIMKIVHKYSNEDIEECLRLAESSGFLTGKNDRGWKADIDFILREDKFVSILEGKYKTKYKRNNAITDMDVRSNTMSKDDLKEFKEAIKNGELQRF